MLSSHFALLKPEWNLVAVFLAVTWGIWHIRIQLASIMSVFLGVLLLGAMVSPPYLKLHDDRIDTSTAGELGQTWARSGAFDTRLPIVLHLVFDEMISPGAIPVRVPGGTDLRASLYSLGREHGFRIFDSVYAREFFSAISIPNVLNAEYAGRSATDEILLEQQTELKENPYFDDLERRGYRTAVFQTAVMNFCASGRVDLCETFDSFDPGGDGEDGADVRSRVTALAQTIVRAYEPSYSSLIGTKVLYKASLIRMGDYGVLGIADRYDVQRFPQWFDRFATFAATVPRGSHVFAHFLVPHAPYLLTRDCRVSGTFEAGYYLASRFPAAERQAKRTEYYTAYIEQMRCVQSKIEDLLQRILELDSYRDAVIVIHGDHGSRISNGNVVEDLGARDFLDNYGTFFAVKAPEKAAGVDCTFTSLGEVLRQQFSPLQAGLPAGKPLPVVITSRDNAEGRVEAPMPKFGCASDDH